MKDDKGPARSFVHLMGWTYPSLFDPSPTADVETRIGYYAQPVTLFYNRSGRIVDQASGPATETDLSAGIRRILA